MLHEEIRRVRHDMSPKTSVAAIRDYETSDINRRTGNERDTSRSHDSDNRGSPTSELLTTEQAVWQNESDKLNPLELTINSRTKGTSFKMAKFTSESLMMNCPSRSH